MAEARAEAIAKEAGSGREQLNELRLALATEQQRHDNLAGAAPADVGARCGIETKRLLAAGPRLRITKIVSLAGERIEGGGKIGIDEQKKLQEERKAKSPLNGQTRRALVDLEWSREAICAWCGIR